MMSCLNLETKHLVFKGWEQVKNPLFYQLTQKHSYSMKDRVDSIGVAFYVAPYINATLRSGMMDEKHIIFRAMLTSEAFKRIPSTKRGSKPGDEETVLTQATRNITNIKNRQAKAQEKGMSTLSAYIEDNNLLDDGALVILQDGSVDKNIAGLVAMKFANLHQRPSMVLSKGYRLDDDENKITIWSGSARGYERKGIVDFKEDCLGSGLVNYAAGHGNAFGISIDEDKIEMLIQYLNNLYKDIDDEPMYFVDFIFNGEDFTSDTIMSIEEGNHYWGKDFPEPLIAISELKVTANMVTVNGQKATKTLNIKLPNGVSLVKFHTEEEEYSKFQTEGYIIIDVIGKASLNEWNGRVTPQIMIEDYNILHTVDFCF